MRYVDRKRILAAFALAIVAASTVGAETLETGGTASTGVVTGSTGTMSLQPVTGTTVTAPLQGVPKPGERLSLQQCVDIALRRNPTIFAADYTVNAADARVGQALSAYYPQIDLLGGYSKYSISSNATSTLSGISQPRDLYQGSATLTQNIFDFGRTPSAVRIQRLNEDAARSDRRNTVSQVVYNVKQAYYNRLQAEKNLDVAIETVKLTRDQLDQAQGFYDAGIKSKYDVTSAEVNLSNARLAQIRAENSVSVARVTLKNAMGDPEIPDFAIEDTLAFHKYPVTFDDAVQRAYANRPDLQSAVAKREASKESVTFARTGYYPTLSGNANYTKAGDTTLLAREQNAWSAGVTLTIPLFSGFLTNYQVKEAKENLNVQKANEETLRQSILLDVQQAYLNMTALEEGVAVAELSVQQSQENYDIVNGRYGAGVGSPLDVTNALVNLANAKTNYIFALATYKIAEAALLKAMGE